MKTGRLLIVFLALTVLLSCSRKEEAQKGSAGIINDYTKTLSSAPQKAKDAADRTDEHGEQMKKSIEELDR